MLEVFCRTQFFLQIHPFSFPLSVLLKTHEIHTDSSFYSSKNFLLSHFHLNEKNKCFHSIENIFFIYLFSDWKNIYQIHFTWNLVRFNNPLKLIRKIKSLNQRNSWEKIIHEKVRDDHGTNWKCLPSLAHDQMLNENERKSINGVKLKMTWKCWLEFVSE